MQSKRFRVARKLLRAEVYYIAALAAFAVLTGFVYFNSYFGWDLRATLALQGVGDLYGFMRFVSKAGDGWTPFALTGATALVFLIFRKKSEASGIVFSAAGSALIARFIKVTIARPRPAADLVTVLTEGDLLSFPSGHVTFYVTFFGFLFFVAFANLPRRSVARWLAMLATALPVVLIGFSRVYLGRHWPSDALGAYLMGGLWLAVSLDLYRRRKARVKVTNET
jgi:undecaprenyl-diphosphatase